MLEERTRQEEQSETRAREEVPFRLVRSDGTAIDLSYSSPRPAEEHDERAVLETLPWFEPGKPLRNWMLHETDFYDEVEQIWGRRWGAEVIWSKVLTALQVPIYLTIHGRGIGEPGAGRWLDSNTFVFNESVVANDEGLRQIRFVLESLGIELIVAHSPGWVDSIGNGNIGTSHMDMVMLAVDERKVLLAPHLVNYGFVRELKRREVEIIEVPLDEYWDLAINGVTLAPGKVLLNEGSPSVVRALDRAGVEVIQVDFSESHKFAIAGLHCATLELVRD